MNTDKAYLLGLVIGGGVGLHEGGQAQGRTHQHQGAAER